MDPAPLPARELVLTGPAGELILPDLCARCGAPAKGRLYFERVFQVHNGEGYRHEVGGALAPFCPACLAQHEREVKRMTALESLLQCLRSEMMIPAAFTGAGTLFLAYVLLPKVTATDWKSLAFFAAVVGFFALITWGSLRAAWDATRHHTVPPLTTVTASFDFGLDISNTFEGERHRYVLHNEAFFEALRAANEHRAWKRSGNVALAAANKRAALYVVLGALALVAVLWDWIEPWMPWKR